MEAAYAPYVDAIGAKPAPMLDDYDRLIENGTVWVAEAGGRIAGLIVMWPEADHWFVDNIAVDPNCQGAGVGSVLLRVAEQSARLGRKSEIRLYTNEAMTSNTLYYSKRGFVETHRAVDCGFRRIFYSRVVPFG